jgi:hypothetical protein
MSKNTMKQRIALVAVSTLTAGVLSVISAPIANAAVGDVTANTLWLASTNSTTGVPIVTALGGNTAADKNTGFVAITSTTGTAQGIGTGQAGTVGTASALPTARLVFNTQGGAVTDAVSLNVSGGTISSESVVVVATSNVLRIVTTGLTTITATAHGFSVGQLVQVTSAAIADTGIYPIVTVVDADNFTFTSAIKTAVTTTAQEGSVRSVTYDGQSSVVRNPGGTPTLAAIVTPTGAVGTTMTVSAYKGASVTVASPTNGTLLGQWVITIVASGSAGVFSAGDSNVSTQVQQVKGIACTAAATFDDVASIVNGSTACIHVNPKDIYGTAVTTGTITASATNSAKVLVSAANAAAGFLAAAPFSSAPSAANLYVVVIPATAGVGQTTTVTLTWNGVVIGTKNITFQGDIAKLTFVAASSKTNYKNGSTAIVADGGLLAVAYVATDALGQAVTLTAGPTISDATGAMTPAVLNNTNNGVIGVLQTAALGGGASAVTIASNALVGAGTFRIKLTNAAGVDIKSDVINATVSTGAATFTAAWDKASYSPGEIAVLTVTAKDSGGRGVAQGVAFGTNAAITINTDGFTSLTVACDTLSTQTVKGTDGSRTCNYAVKNTAGAYAYSVSVPTSSAQSAIGGTLKINADTTAVSNADVLKSIVALIASINKQIQALQKLILKR